MGALLDAAKSGDRRQTLIVLRNRLADEIESTQSSRDVASLSRQLTDVLAEIDELPTGAEEQSKADEIAQRREQRRKAAVQ